MKGLSNISHVLQDNKVIRKYRDDPVLRATDKNLRLIKNKRGKINGK